MIGDKERVIFLRMVFWRCLAKQFHCDLLLNCAARSGICGSPGLAVGFTRALAVAGKDGGAVEDCGGGVQGQFQVGPGPQSDDVLDGAWVGWILS